MNCPFCKSVKVESSNGRLLLQDSNIRLKWYNCKKCHNVFYTLFYTNQELLNQHSRKAAQKKESCND